jgi:group I intron endonuclease
MITYYTVYKVTNTINRKFYIGTHKTVDLNDTYMGSGKYLKYSQTKHGMENFEKEILHVFDNPEEMFAKEKELVNIDFIAESNTYNLKEGGLGGWDSYNADKQALAERNLRINAQRDYDDPIYRNNHKRALALIDTSLMMEKRTQTLIDRYGTTANRSFLGKTHTDETKRKIGEKNSVNQTGNGNSQYGSMWIYSLEEQRSMKIKKDDNIPEGWLKGRKI